MKSPLGPLQAAIYQRLTASADLMAKVKGVFDAVPDNQAFPYVTLGEDTDIEWSSRPGAMDGHEVTHTLHIWSRYKGFAEAKQIGDLVTQAITSAPLALSGGFRAVSTGLDMVQYIRDQDGVTRHGVIRFRFRIQEV